MATQEAEQQLQQDVAWAGIPQAIIVQALEHVNVRERHSSCALVSTAWAAAVSLTRSCQVTLTDDAFDTFLSWLTSSRGQQTTSLDMQVSKVSGEQCNLSDWDLLAHLPSLQDLRLQGYNDTRLHAGLLVDFHALFGGAGSTAWSTRTSSPEELELFPAAPAPAPAAPALTRLVLHTVSLAGATPAEAAANLEAVTAVTSLKHLELGNCAGLMEVPGSLLHHLVQLTHLSWADSVSNDSLADITCLQNLKQLKLGLLVPFAGATDAQGLIGLSTLQQLTALSLFGCWFPIGDVSMPWFSQKLTGLRKLYLHSISTVQPAALSGLTQLQSLHIKASLLTGTACQGRMPAAGEAEAGMAALLEWLSHLRQLTHLSLPGVLGQASPAAAGTGAPAAYSSLTASSCLRRLNLAQARLPAEAWQHIFCADRQLLHLTALALLDVSLAAANTSRSPPAAAAASAGVSAAAGGASFASLVRCCPQLQQLHIDCCGADVEAQMQQLAELRGLTALTVHYYSGMTTAKAVAGLTRLRELCVMSVRTITRSELLPLTALTQLAALTVLAWGQLATATFSTQQIGEATTTEPRSVSLALHNKVSLAGTLLRRHVSSVGSWLC